MLCPLSASDARRRRQIHLLDVGYIARRMRTGADTLDACSRRAQQILFDAELLLTSASNRVEMSRRMLDANHNDA